MTVTAAAGTLILNATVDVSIDNIDVLSLTRAAGEFFRATYQDVEEINAKERKYIFYLTENDGNDIITKMSLYGNGATVALGSGTEMCSQVVNIDKSGSPGSKSLLVYWYVRVVE